MGFMFAVGQLCIFPTQWPQRECIMYENCEDDINEEVKENYIRSSRKGSFSKNIYTKSIKILYKILLTLARIEMFFSK